MSNDKKQSGFSAKVAGGIAATVGTIIIAVLTAQNTPWWLPKVEGFLGSNKPSNSDQPTSPPQISTTPSVISTSPSISTSSPSPATPSPSSSTPLTSPSATSPPSLGNDEIWNQKTIQTQVDDGVTWQLKSCASSQNKISCYFLLSPNKDRDYAIANSTRIVSSQAHAYNPSLLQLGDSQSNDLVRNSMVKGLPYRTIIEFDVSDPVSRIALLDIYTRCCWGSGVQFRDIPINPAN